jgi:hypothetical protein
VKRVYQPNLYTRIDLTLPLCEGGDDGVVDLEWGSWCRLKDEFFFFGSPLFMTEWCLLCMSFLNDPFTEAIPFDEAEAETPCTVIWYGHHDHTTD